MKHTCHVLSIFVALALLAGCAPAPTALPTATTTPPPISTSRPLPTFTNTPEPEPTPTAKIEVPLEMQSVTIEAAKEFADAMTVAGTPITFEEVLNQGLVIEQGGKDGNKFEVAKTQDGFPIMIKMEGGEWETRPVVADLFAVNGVPFGFTYDMQNNQYRKIVRPSDDLVGDSSKIVTPEDTFYQSFTFNSADVPKWKNIDEYLAFIAKYNLVSGAPHLYWAGNDHTSQDSAQLINRTKQIVEHCKGSIHAWTVNELFNDNGTPKNENTLANAKAVIETIRETDPTAQIVINDNGMDWTPAKDNAYFDFITELIASGDLREGDVIGYQAHNGIGYNVTSEQFASWFDKYAKLGLKLSITEADVFDVKSLSAANETKKAEIILGYYRAGQILEKKYDRKVLESIIVWGSANNSSWLREIGKQGEYPLFLDDDGSPYLSWYLIAKTLLNDALAK